MKCGIIPVEILKPTLALNKQYVSMCCHTNEQALAQQYEHQLSSLYCIPLYRVCVCRCTSMFAFIRVCSALGRVYLCERTCVTVYVCGPEAK